MEESREQNVEQAKREVEEELIIQWAQFWTGTVVALISFGVSILAKTGRLSFINFRKWVIENRPLSRRPIPASSKI